MFTQVWGSNIYEQNSVYMYVKPIAKIPTKSANKAKIASYSCGETIADD